MKRTALLVAAVIISLLGVAVPARATTNAAGDAVADNSPNYDARGDIVNFGADYTDNTIVLGAQARTPTDPATDPNWINNATAVIWDIDVNGDGHEDYWAIISNFLGVSANVYDENFQQLCQASPEFDATYGVFVAFPASCINTPAGFSIRAYFDYSTGGGNASFDFAPNAADFGAAVTRTVTQVDPTTTTTTAPPTPTGPDPSVSAAGVHDGYWMLTDSGEVYGFGSARNNTVGGTGNVHIEPTPSGDGYWILAQSGAITARGDAANLGPANILPGEKAVSLSATPSGRGVWVFTDKGRVITLGDARFFGDMSGHPLNGAVLGSVATPTGGGYWMVASDGGIFAFGDAVFHGSTGNLKLNKPVMGMAPAKDGSGYWLVASDGGIFAFDVPFYGSMGGTPLNKPISGMVPGDGGYMMVAQDGGIFSFGNVAFHGSLGANPPASPVVNVALQP